MRNRNQKSSKSKQNGPDVSEDLSSGDGSAPDSGQQGETGVANRGLCRRCLGVSKYLIVFILAPPFLNYASLSHEAQQLLPSGALYDIGFGQKLFLGCQGKGKPTVLLDAPTGMTSDVWALVQPELAKYTKVCVYDRAGIGFSDRPPVNYSEESETSQSYKNKWKEFTVERMVDDVHRLITYSSQQERPLIYVGAELGGMIARFYTQIYESDVSDVVLIDPIVEDLFSHDQGVWADLWFRHLLPYFQAHQLSSAIGVNRIALILRLMSPPLSVEAMPEEVMQRQKHMMCNPRHLSSVVDEYHFINESMSQMQTVFMMKGFPSNVSVTVLNGNYFDEQLPTPLNKAWAKSQQTLISQIHSNSKHIVVNGADHHMLYRQPGAVIEPIKRLIKQWRSRQKTSESR